MGKIIKGIGKIAKFAAPFIPGVGPLAAAGIGAAGSLLSKGKKANLGDVLGGAATGGLGRLGISQLGEGGKLSGIGRVLGQTGKSIGQSFMTPEGGLDIGRVAGAGTGILNLIGQRQQRKSAERRLGAEDEVRNQLLSQLLTQPRYDFTPGQ